MAYKERKMDINPADIQKLTKEYEQALTTADENGDLYERLIVLEENQLDAFDCMLRTSRCGRTVTYLKNLSFRILNILSVKNGQNAYLPSVRTPSACGNALSRATATQLDIFVLADKINLPFSDKAEFLSLENRKLAVLNTLRP